ncbi:hypothetical protein [uncultured Ligilactobacillus sp.]|uniref:hypothetical protein n=1 Tax=uncultured Ligilactobacillus sp. TaxID=2837633 RepID=UPI00259A8758|nr:hypothetical protein [uncultured Ligilactobacillus sp.]
MKLPKIVWRADLSGTAFGKSSAVYGHIDRNGHVVRKWPALKKAITDKSGKNSRLSVNPQHNGQKFTDKSLKNGGLSVKCVLLTDKPSKKDYLSVKLE